MPSALTPTPKAQCYRYLPEHWISRILGKLASAKAGFATQYAIKKFSRHYQVNLAEATESNLKNFESFNAFFTRTLKPELRPIASTANAIACPADCTVYAAGKLTKDIHIEAKKTHFTLQNLLGGDTKLANCFAGGDFVTLYLSPKDYHRVHTPVTGLLEEMIYIPGRLFSVKPKVVEKTDQLFARNERVVCIFNTALGKVAVILVGATIVGSIRTVWHGVVKNKDLSKPTVWHYEQEEATFNRGEELGAFLLGSTVIVLFEPDKIQFSKQVQSQHPLLMGSLLAEAIIPED